MNAYQPRVAFDNLTKRAAAEDQCGCSFGAWTVKTRQRVPPRMRRANARTMRADPELARPRSSLEDTRKELSTLYAALENIDSGVLLLDKDLRAQFSNTALHVMFKSLSPRAILENKPLYAEMLEHAKRSNAYDVSPAEIDEYVSRRLAWVRSGDAAPVDLRLSSGRVIRCHCAVLPGGGRMLTFSDVTDIVQNAELLEQLATVDGMTGIFNRRHFMTLAEREWNRSRRYCRPLSFLMIDIDFFKTINDKFGHDFGDRVIVHVTSMARNCKRDSDVLARIGGEEFAMLLPETDLVESRAVAERLRGTVVVNPLKSQSLQIPATVSIGVACASDDMADMGDLMKAADSALYESKRRGRNRVTCSTESANFAESA